MFSYLHIWQHYLFTGNKEFLKEYYPILKGTAQFYMDFLVEHPVYKWLVVSPSVSPEHGPITAGCTMDNQIAFDALHNTLLASYIAGEAPSFQDSLKQTLEKLPPMQIGKHNQLQEWLEDVDNPKDEHRHISHLYGLYPSYSRQQETHCFNAVIKLPVGVSAGKSISGHVCWMETMPSKSLKI